MSDIVERLREREELNREITKGCSSLGWQREALSDADLDKQAGDRIEALEAENARLINEKASGEFWRGVFSDATDKSEREKIADELSDYRFMLDQVPAVYMHITGGLLSKPNYHAHAVIAAADDYESRCREEDYQEKDAELARLRSLTEWQAIETAAPKPNEMSALISLDRDGCFRWACFGSISPDGRWRAWLGGGIQTPTHWMPLPPPPQPKE